MYFVNRPSIVAPFLLTFAFMAHATHGFAGVIGAEEATKLLARSQAIEEKCKFLTSSQHDELSAFVAKAEIAIVAKSSASSAKSIISAGRSLGRSAACSEAEHADVMSIIGAAQQATSTSAKIVTVPKLQQEPVALNVAPKKSLVIAKPSDKEPKAISAHIVETGSLSHYAQLTQRYYIARRCNTMSYASITNFYKDVVTTHKNAVASFGVPAVRSVMNQSASKADATSCG